MQLAKFINFSCKIWQNLSQITSPFLYTSLPQQNNTNYFWDFDILIQFIVIFVFSDQKVAKKVLNCPICF